MRPFRQAWLPAACFLLLCAASPGEGLAVRQETLGSWHYLIPPDGWQGAGVRFSRDIASPTAVALGKGRIATFLPYSEKLVELKDGSVVDLHLPAGFCPDSLAVDRNGVLLCLAQKTQSQIRDPRDLHKRWILRLGESSWECPKLIPCADCVRIEADSRNRLWCLGLPYEVAVLADGRWSTSRLAEGPVGAPVYGLGEIITVAMTENARGDIILFNKGQQEEPWDSHPFEGTETYRDGKFIHDPKADTAALREAQRQRDLALAKDDDFPREAGYVVNRGEPRTVLRTNLYTLVSVDYRGLAWAKSTELSRAPADAAWKAVDGVYGLPAVDPSGDLWMLRKDPTRLVRFSKEGMEEFPTGLSYGCFPFIACDKLNRPWISGGNGVVFNHGTFKSYPAIRDALQAEAPAFQPGRILPETVKAPDGALCMVSLREDEVLFIRHGKARTFPVEGGESRGRHTGSAQGTTWLDKVGRIHATVSGRPFHWEEGRLIPDAPETAPKTPPLPNEPRQTSGPYDNTLTAPDGRQIVFTGFHFYTKTQAGLKQLDSGVNPLAAYPLWACWSASPGNTVPLVDSAGRIWVRPSAKDLTKWFVPGAPVQ